MANDAATRVTTVVHRGRRVFQIDFNGCRPGAFAPIIAEAERRLSAEPARSVLALTILSDVRFDGQTVLEMKRFVSNVNPFLKANALVGIDGMKKVVFYGVKPLYAAPVELFDDHEAGKDWLASAR